MVHAGADITANLILNATDFVTNLEKTSSAVAKFKESMLDMGKNSTTVRDGINNTNKALNQLTTQLTKFSGDGIGKAVARFKEFSLGLEHIALAAQRLAIDAQQDAVGIQTLTTVMDIWRSGVESAEIKVTGLATALRNMKTTTTEASSSFKSSLDVMKAGLNALALDITRTGTVMTDQEARMVYQAQMLKQEYGVAFNSVGTSFRNLNTTMQSWKSLTDSVVNSTTQNIVTSTEKVKVSLGNLSTSVSNTSTSLNTIRGSLTGFGTALNTTTAQINSSKMSLINWGEIAQQFSTKVNMAKTTLVNLGTIIQGTTTRTNANKMTLIDLWNVYSRGNTVINPTVRSIEMMNSALERNRTEVMALITGQNQETASLERNSIAVRENGAERLRAMGYTGKLTIEEEKETASVEKNTQSHYRNANAMSQSSARASQLSSATSRLGKAMSSLKMIGTMVGSMLAYNYAHKLLVATGETIHAKSEMEGYFKMLNFGQSDINHFNKALDKTISQFQRVNKYALGETISSIGVEFNLTTKEMEKAMPVVSMITSEYLRAGRNVNEASLAVKDILQGEFQRLSRETGVKGQQLMDAGWSGDKTDVMGLLEALDKVGKSRNWDVFAEKANSLNDILTIIQNRFGEWSAEMVYAVQPTIVGVFNMILGSAQKLASGLSGIWEWLNTDSLESNIAKWTTYGSVITTVIGMLIAYRTGANLVQIAQMGLTRTIASTVLGLQAETVATYGTRTAIMSKIFGLEAEKVATLNVKDAILSKILGLDAELVAQTSLKQGILDSAFAQELQTMKLKGATAEEMMNTLALYENQLAQKSSIGILSAQILKLDMSTYAQHGFTVALLESTTALKGNRIAMMNWAEKLGLLIASIGVPTAIVGAFTIAFGTLALQMRDNAKVMGEFNKFVKDGKSIIQDARSEVETYTDRQEALKNKLNETKKDTIEYHQIQEKLRDTNAHLTTANYDLKNSIKAVEIANSSQKHYEEALTDMSIEHQHNLAQAYLDAGFSAQESYEMANDSLINAQNGAEQLRLTLQKIAQLQYKGEQNTSYLLSHYKDSDVDKEEQKKSLAEAERLNKRASDDLTKAMTDESFMGRIDGWLGYYTSQIEIWIHNIQSMVSIGDWGAVFENVWKGIAHGFADLPLFKDFWGWIYDQLGVENYKGQGWDAFGNIGKDIIKSIFDPSKYADNGGDFDPIGDIGRWFSSSLANGVNSWFEPLKDIDIIGMIFDAILPSGVSASDGESSDHPSFMEDVSNLIGFDIQSWIDGFPENVLSKIGMPSIDLFGLFESLFGNGENGGGINLGGWLNSIFDISGWISNFTGYLSGIVSNVQSTVSSVMDGFNNMKNTVSTNIGNIVSTATQGFQNVYNNSRNSLINLKDSTSQVIHSMVDAWTGMKDKILDSARQIWDGVKSKFDSIGDTLKGFYQKIQNPSSWAGSPSLRSNRSPKPSVGRTVAKTITGRGYAGGNGSKAPTGNMSIGQLKRILCPDGNCGNLFDGYNNSDVVDASSFLNLVREGHGFGGWNFANTHKDYIKNKAYKWDTGSPVIKLLGGIQTSAKFKVGDFDDGTPKISFEQFKSMAQAIFSAIPYKFYYDSSWKGSWLGALQAGACNCYDGALALIAFANACGFGGSMAHGTWTDPDGTSYPHVWATINGMKMDTTAWQQRGSWSAGSPTVSSAHTSRPTSNQPPVNIIVNVENAYGIDDLNSQIEEGIDKGLQKHFNKSLAVGI